MATNSPTRYNLASIIYEDKEIITETFKTTRKLDTEEYKASNSYQPYAINFKSETFEWEMSKIDPIYRSFFEDLLDNHKNDPGQLCTLATYDYNPITGDLVEDDVYDGAFIKEISKENANKPFSVKGGALRKLNK